MGVEQCYAWYCMDCRWTNTALSSTPNFCFGCGRGRRFKSGDLVAAAEARRKGTPIRFSSAVLAGVRTGDRLHIIDHATNTSRIRVFDCFSTSFTYQPGPVILVLHPSGGREVVYPRLNTITILDAEPKQRRKKQHPPTQAELFDPQSLLTSTEAKVAA